MYTVKIVTACNPKLTKNNKFAHKTDKILIWSYRKARDDVAWALKAEIIKAGYPDPKPKTKIYVDYIWYRKTHAGDTSNFREGIDDAVKMCLPVDDRYYAGKQDWFIDKINPRLEISVSWGE